VPTPAVRRSASIVPTSTENRRGRLIGRSMHPA
jgi:hypothetical protein